MFCLRQLHAAVGNARECRTAFEQAGVSSMSPNFLNLPMKMFTRERVVPTISVTISRDTRGSAHRHGRRSSQPVGASSSTHREAD
jgi:hypothetical protein